jgi:hypothetical protein
MIPASPPSPGFAHKLGAILYLVLIFEGFALMASFGLWSIAALAGGRPFDPPYLFSSFAACCLTMLAVQFARDFRPVKLPWNIIPLSLLAIFLLLFGAWYIVDYMVLPSGEPAMRSDHVEMRGFAPFGIIDLEQVTLALTVQIPVVSVFACLWAIFQALMTLDPDFESGHRLRRPFRSAGLAAGVFYLWIAALALIAEPGLRAVFWPWGGIAVALDAGYRDAVEEGYLRIRQRANVAQVKFVSEEDRITWWAPTPLEEVRERLSNPPAAERAALESGLRAEFPLVLSWGNESEGRRKSMRLWLDDKIMEDVVTPLLRDQGFDLSPLEALTPPP